MVLFIKKKNKVKHLYQGFYNLISGQANANLYKDCAHYIRSDNLTTHSTTIQIPKTQTYPLSDTAAFKRQALSWANTFDTLCYLDNNQYHSDKYHSYEALLAVGVKRELATETQAFPQLKQFAEAEKSWLFGFLTYDLKNETENLPSNNFDGIGMPALHFFQPEYVLEIKEKEVTIHAQNPDEIWQKINSSSFSANINISGSGSGNISNSSSENANQSPVTNHQQPITNHQSPTTNTSTHQHPNTSIHQHIPHPTPRIPKTDYLKTVEKIRQHIIEGDLYEMNFCQEFYAEDIDIQPLDLFSRLNHLAKAPFSAFYKYNNRYLLSASPERFMKKEGKKLISQPIKGTIKRGNSLEEDAQLQATLRESEKDQAENVMIVDLVRNDLTRSCETGSIEVEELFGVYPFEQVHHLISTVSATLRKDVHPVDAIRHAFPMGSMTGAPKVMSMKLIEQYEQTKRGLYSGSVGYFTPDGDFDFNVVIRSILYNADTKYLSFQVGGAIVYDSVPELEYEECLLKAKAMLEVLGVKSSIA